MIDLDYDDIQCDDFTNTLEKTQEIIGSTASACAQRRAEADLDAATAANENQDGAETGNGYWDRDWENNCIDAYNSNDDQCGCYGEFGKDNDGEVRHYGLYCQYCP